MEQKQLKLINAILKHLNGIDVVYYQIKHLVPRRRRCNPIVFLIIVEDFYTKIHSFLCKREKSNPIVESLIKFEVMVDSIVSDLRPKPRPPRFFSSKLKLIQ